MLIIIEKVTVDNMNIFNLNTMTDHCYEYEMKNDSAEYKDRFRAYIFLRIFYCWYYIYADIY